MNYYYLNCQHQKKVSKPANENKVVWRETQARYFKLHNGDILDVQTRTIIQRDSIV